MRRRREQAKRRAPVHGKPEDQRSSAHDPANDQHSQTAALHALQAAIHEGLDSGVSA
ncbi:MAG: hypothetical protein OXO54_08305 [Chloroflexota bacterium]|nr:hypothetical protein [Chloroflexota bacterium]MDE2898310.1 hypothetical protein [Chloroflexota bacterium]